MELLRQVAEAIRRGRLLAPGERVAVACSGGADSVALLLLLRELQPTLGIRLAVAHLNHQLRGAEADADEAFVRALAEHLGLDFFAARADVAARAAGSNLEEAGRQARLDFFSRLCAEDETDAVATAHTLDDQAETLLARLVRGTGLTGLAGIRPVLELQPGRLVRPLVGIRRATLRSFLAERQQPWREDGSNRDPARLRIRLRQELLPQLERLNPAAAEHLAALAGQAAQEESFWRLLIEERFRTLARPGGLARQEQDAWWIAAWQLAQPLGDLYAALVPARQVEAAQRAVAQRLVRRLVEAVRGHTRRLTDEHVAAVLRLAHAGESGQQLALPGVRVERSFDRLVFRPAGGRRAGVSYRYEVAVPGVVDIPPAGQRLAFKLVATRELAQGYNASKVAALDADALGLRASRLTVRNWQPGDSYQPVGARRPKKLKTLFQRARVPAEARASYPVLLRGEEIIWAPQLGAAAGCAVGERTRTVLLISQEPLGETR